MTSHPGPHRQYVYISEHIPSGVRLRNTISIDEIVEKCKVCGLPTDLATEQMLANLISWWNQYTSDRRHDGWYYSQEGEALARENRKETTAKRRYAQGADPHRYYTYTGTCIPHLIDPHVKSCF